jgi:AcrR family transcriptional regulator
MEGEVVSLSAPVEGDKPNGPRSRKGVQTRARLVAAAKEVFEENGFLDARISDIAERAGLSHGSFYHYFESKEEIFREVAATVDELLAAPQRTVVLDPSSRAAPRDRIHEAMRQYLASYREEAKIVGVIEQVSRYDDEVGALRLARHRRYVQEMAGSVRQLQLRGRANAKIDPEIVAAALGSLTTRFAETWLVEGAVECSFDDAVDQLTLLFVNALGLTDGKEPAGWQTED